MSAYIIVDINVKNQEEYEKYKKLTPATLAAHNGKFIVRGGNTEILEGDWNPGRLVILEFPTMEQAKKWWSSEEYEPAKKIRQSCADTNMVAAEGFE